MLVEFASDSGRNRPAVCDAGDDGAFSFYELHVRLDTIEVMGILPRD